MTAPAFCRLPIRSSHPPELCARVPCTVAVYRGVQGSLLGYELSSLSSDSKLTVGTLPYFDQELVSKGIPAKDEADAQRIIAELTSHAIECQTVVPAPSGCPGSPT